MRVTKMMEPCEQQIHGGHLFTDEQLRKEYDYIIAENITRKMLEKGLISVDEFNKIMAENRKRFSPILADILA